MITAILCLLYIALIYVRPGEIVPELASLRLPMVVLILGSVSAAASLFMKPRRFLHLPGDVCFVGFIAATMLSNPVNGRFTVGPGGLEQLLPLVAFYVFIRIAIRTERQVRVLIGLVIVLTMIQAANGIAQAWTGVGLGGSTAVTTPTGGGPDDFENPDGVAVARVRGTGIFGDPNDLAMALLLVVPFLLTSMLDADNGVLRRLLAVAMLGALVYAVYLTHSRGGFVGLAAIVAAYGYRRAGRVAAVAGAVVLFGVLLAGLGQNREISASEESAQGRIQAWAAGFDMLKASPVLGVGAGEFVAHHVRVAHNSFVHVFAETGLVGLFCFVGMFYWFFVSNGPLRNVEGAADSGLARDLWASTIGLIVCAMFLSQQYVPILYIPLALGAARITIAREPAAAAAAMEEPAGSPEPIGRWWDWLVQGGVTVGVVVITYGVIRTLVV